MSAAQHVAPEWEARRTDETRYVEDILRQHFDAADAYRYNSASIRVRVIDDQFRGLSREERDERVEPYLSGLDESTQADIINLVLLYPDEAAESYQASINNEEFEHPSQSML